LNVNLPGGGINGANPGTFAFTLFNSGLTRFLNLEVSALEADGKAKTISSPRVVTSDGKEATISQGTEIPYLQASSSGAANVAFKPATMELKVIPQITPDGRVTLDLEVKKDSVGQNTSAGPAIDTKQVKTAVLVDNGGTIVIGGIFTVSETNSENKVPVLGDIPVLGNAFKNRQKETSKKEMVIMITPRVIENISNAQ
jgi:type IV pilus assembly protein PilQ